MLPFVRSGESCAAAVSSMAESGLLSRTGFELWVMAEVPSVLFNLAEYVALGVAGISIGSNDLTQLLLGADRDSELLAETFDERDPAVTAYLRELIPRAHALGLRTSICGQAPSVHPEYADLLVEAGRRDLRERRRDRPYARVGRRSPSGACFSQAARVSGREPSRHRARSSGDVRG